MTTVIDASVLVAATTDDGPEGHWASTVLESGPLLAPQLALVEATNIVRRLELTSVITPPHAANAINDLLAFRLDLLPFSPFVHRIWQLRENVTSYDAWYVAIAEAFDVRLATLDTRLTRATGPRCRFLSPAPSR